MILVVIRTIIALLGITLLCFEHPILGTIFVIASIFGISITLDERTLTIIIGDAWLEDEEDEEDEYYYDRF